MSDFYDNEREFTNEPGVVLLVRPVGPAGATGAVVYDCKVVSVLSGESAGAALATSESTDTIPVVNLTDSPVTLATAQNTLAYLIDDRYVMQYYE